MKLVRWAWARALLLSARGAGQIASHDFPRLRVQEVRDHPAALVARTRTSATGSPRAHLFRTAFLASSDAVKHGHGRRTWASLGSPDMDTRAGRATPLVIERKLYLKPPHGSKVKAFDGCHRHEHCGNMIPKVPVKRRSRGLLRRRSTAAWRRGGDKPVPWQRLDGQLIGASR